MLANETQLSHIRVLKYISTINLIDQGQHVDKIVEQICRRIQQEIEQQNRNNPAAQRLNIRNSTQIKRHLHLWLNARVENPTFDSQTKETLHSQLQEIDLNLSNDFYKQLLQSTGIVERIMD